MNALIVDDEPIARRVLREELELFPDVRVMGEAGDDVPRFSLPVVIWKAVVLTRQCH